MKPLAGAVVGLAFIISGIAAGLSYSRNRSWHIQELRKASSIEELAMMERTAAKKAHKKRSNKV